MQDYDSFEKALTDLICAGKLEEADTMVRNKQGLSAATMAAWEKSITLFRAKQKEGYKVVGLSKRKPGSSYIHEISNTVH